MSSDSQTYSSFGPDVALSSLPTAFQSCLPPNDKTDDCDDKVGNMSHGGYCGNKDPVTGLPTADAYGRMTYCACVNNAISCPEYSSAACGNSAFAYRPAAWYKGAPSIDDDCQDTPICVNIMEVDGDQNIIKDVDQQCGTFKTIQLVLGTSPVLAAFAFVLVIVLIALLLAKTEGPAHRFPPPPPPGLTAFLSRAQPPPAPT